MAPIVAFGWMCRFARWIATIAGRRFPMNSPILEGVNNRIKVIKYMAYGFRNSASFFLKIKVVFPGKVR